MTAIRFNHVSVHAYDLEESARFYEQVFGMERIPSPAFPHSKVLWLRCGDQQLHLFQREHTEATPFHHFSLDVDDFEAVYLRAREGDFLDKAAWWSTIWEHPAGWLQMYIRDPAGNLIEVDCPDAASVDRSIVTEIQMLPDQRGEHANASVYLAGVSQ